MASEASIVCLECCPTGLASYLERKLVLERRSRALVLAKGERVRELSDGWRGLLLPARGAN